MFSNDTVKYIFPTIPIRQTKKPDVNSQVEVDVSSADKKKLKNEREKCVDFFENVRKHLGRKGNAVDERLNTSDACERFVSELVNLVDTYASSIASVVAKLPQFASWQYYYWSSSLADAQQMAFDDYRYELLGMYYNVGACLMNIAQYLLSVRVTVGSLSVLEKDSYRVLIKAAGYFHICGEIVDNMKSHEIGVAQVPIPLDTAKALQVLLESLALAQAQEIGVSKAFTADSKEAADTTARLSHQLFLMYEAARNNAQRVSTRNEEFIKVSTLIVVKADVFRALAYQHAASHVMTKTPDAALSILAQGQEYAKILEDYLTKSQKGKIKIPYNGERFVELSSATVKNNTERINKINSLVHRAKPAATKVPLPAAQPLATRPDISLPFRLEDKKEQE
ncbi:hypothetical protein ABB37_05499 [Leptomonas pyrrhocoris]|uniref:BRO1 domain-containing protein n=1 Tax=Leptomonas pyrrhocoris TaxID=157538 RepID=A0A0N0DV21_LEPPY|nr:hypothetical protein ABB37_05499 [Leptomonas pyrrhocoris]KPA79742.1 hypothetical protein ABB37_05499 [Leptomonas pyrrhocoris]|eukprot:XP_015658181.1 hypothetical protein ABB37_05499 [Leptomonas pyrrhocoris]